MTEDPRHPAIVRWERIEQRRPWHYDRDDERMGLDVDCTWHFGLSRLGIHHHRLLPGWRSRFPHAESTEDEFVQGIDGTPDVWLDEYLHRLAPGDAVGFPAGTGLARSVRDNTDQVVRLIVVGDRSRPDNGVVYPLNREQRAGREDWWEDAPDRPRGPHDGRTEARRAEGGPKG